MNEKVYKAKSQCPECAPFVPANNDSLPSNSIIANRYLSSIPLAPAIIKLITSAGALENGSIKSANDFSYSAPSYAGNRYRIVGDAGGNWTLVNLLILILIDSQSFYRPVFLKWCPPCNDICPFCGSYHQRLNSKELHRKSGSRMAYTSCVNKLY